MILNGMSDGMGILKDDTLISYACFWKGVYVYHHRNNKAQFISAQFSSSWIGNRRYIGNTVQVLVSMFGLKQM